MAREIHFGGWTNCTKRPFVSETDHLWIKLTPCDAKRTSSSNFLFSLFWFPSIQIISEGDHSPTTPIPTPRKGNEEQAVVVPVAVPVAMPVEAAAGPATPIPMPRQNPAGEAAQGELADKVPDEVLSESDKSESDVSTKTSSSDSGIEDGKCTPTSDEEKVILYLFYCSVFVI